MIYQAYLNDELFFDTQLISTSNDSLRLISAKLKLKVNAAGEFTFEIPPQNAKYGCFNRMVDYVSVYRDGVQLFYGRVYSVKGEWNTAHKITVMGIYSALGDTMLEPFTFNSTLDALVQTILDYHNERSAVQFALGNITVEDSNDYVYRDYEARKSPKDRFEDLRDTYGGYMICRNEDGVNYLDWYAEAIGTIDQEIEFGENLIELTHEVTSDDIVTVLIPLGATETDDDGNTTTVDITSVTDDGVNYIEHEEGVEKYGKIWEEVTWEDVSTPSTLLQRGTEYLNTKNESVATVEASAYDTANSQDGFSHFLLCYNIPVTSPPHDLEFELLCTELELDLLNPSEDEITLGGEIDGYVKSAAKSVKSTTQEITRTVNTTTLNEIQSAVETLTTILSETYLTQDSESITALAEKIEALGDELTEYQAQIELLADEINLMVSADDLSTWIQLTSEYLLIGQSGSDIHSEQDNDSFCFVDSAGNVLLRITASDGVDASAFSASEQIAIKSGGIDGVQEWALRLGAVQDNGYHNLNIVYIGG